MSTRSVGAEAERFAHQILTQQGYRIVETNARARTWELDVIAWENDTLCFVEIRSTKTLDFGGPLASVGAKKQRQIVRGATAWLAAKALAPTPFIRFDVLGVWGPVTERQFEIVRGAFVAE